ncbi:MAG TPA: hypothetical protein VKM94_19910 [Blastocatellia bacterium]|nr:hypothetical protein [Blastocatellia bacterium]
MSNKNKIGAVLLAAFVLQSNARTLLPQAGFLQSLLRSGYQRNDEVSAFEARFESLKREVSNQTVVGYVTSDEIRDNWLRYDHDLFMAQYVLAPVIVKESHKERVVIGNFPDDAKAPSRIDRDGLVLTRDLSNGLGIYEHRDQ